MSATTDAPDLDVAEDDETGWDDGATDESHAAEWQWADANGGGF